MLKVVFKELYLLSKTELAAKKIIFHEKRTVILGENDTGKSSLIKSIYYILGADVKFHKKWEAADIIGLLKICYCEVDYWVLRYKSVFGVFSNDGKLIKASSSISTRNGIGSYFAELFSFKLVLKQSQNGVSYLATPAFQYLPFYIDQDKGWANPWSSFERLDQFSGWRKDLIDYHSGIKPKEFYTITAQINEYNNSLKQTDSELRITKNAQLKFEEKQKAVLFDIDVDSYKKEIHSLLKKCGSLNKEQEKYRAELTELKNREIVLQHQQDITKRSLAEVEKDYKYVIKNFANDNLECPICGTLFENSLINRFKLVEDSESCRLLLLDINKEHIAVLENIKKTEEKYFQNKNLLESLQKSLVEKKERLTLSDLIKSESRKEVTNTFIESIEQYEKEIQQINIKKSDLIEERKKYLNRERQEEIRETFKLFMTLFLNKLSVFGLSEDEYKDMPNQIKETGSDTPRALLAYYYSFINTMLKYSSSTLFPIIIDSPNQQDQDKDNLLKIMNVSLNASPEGCQLILGSVDLYGVEYNGYIIKLEDKYQLLNANEYKEVNEFVSPYLNLAIDNIDANGRKD